MIDHELDRATSVLHVRPKGPLTAEDFASLAAQLDPFVEETGGLQGLLIEAREFPGWDNLGAMLKHLRFVRNHHHRIGKVALVTDSRLGDLAESLAGHFVAAQVKHFPADQLPAAHAWLIAD